ncbi:MAG TPA: hypothetical protein VMT89_14785, partial [Candidatus Acidoferrales bacterium]|nr:hypothetical protein [Candidatus Acidoferrales bacterium]
CRAMPAKAAPAKSASLSQIYDQLETLLKQYSPPFVVGPGGKVGSKRHYDLVSPKKIVIAGRERDCLYFASLIEQKGYIGFYYMPSPAVRAKIAPQVLKLLKGQSCYHVKSLDPGLLADIKAALDLGLKHYEREGWI